MRRAFLALAATLLLAGCASMIDSAYEDDQRRECQRSERGVEQAMC